MNSDPTNSKKKGVYGFGEMSTTATTTGTQEPNSKFPGDGKTWNGSVVSPDPSKHRGNDVSSAVIYGGHQKVKKRIKFGKTLTFPQLN
ncbi:hypothetical protein QBC36DRAFT_170413, partial [Triangularia setosa]